VFLREFSNSFERFSYGADVTQGHGLDE